MRSHRPLMPYRRRITIRRQPAGAFVPKRLSLIRGFCVQLSTAFIGMAMPPTVGHVAVNARYLHRQDVDEGTIAAAVTMSRTRSAAFVLQIAGQQPVPEGEI